MVGIIIAAFFHAWHECEALRKKEWANVGFIIPFWGEDWYGRWYSTFDSYHVSFGLTMLTLILNYVVLQPLNVFDNNWIEAGFHFYLFWYVRNIGMHFAFREREFRQPEYLLPMPLQAVYKLFKKN